MIQPSRRNQYDVTDTVRVSHVDEVQAACAMLLLDLYPALNLQPLDRAFDLFARLYAGLLPGYVGCDTWYHDAQHSLDTALATVRLLDGYERSAPAQPLGPRRAVLGVITALFHDAGYVRRREETAANGAEFAAVHVRRSGAVLAGLLPQLGFGAEVAMVEEMVHYTGFERPLDRIAVEDGRDRLLGFIVASADLLAQMADRCYPEKCRDFLFREMTICGMAGRGRPGAPPPLYPSADVLLQQTPAFVEKIWSERIEGFFGGMHRYMALHFGGSDPYRAQIDEHLVHIRDWRAPGRGGLNRRPRAIGAFELRRQLATPIGGRRAA
jgi:hypothetical protein